VPGAGIDISLGTEDACSKCFARAANDVTARSTFPTSAKTVLAYSDRKWIAFEIL